MGDEAKPEPKVKLGWIDYVRMLFKGRAAVETVMREGKLVAAEAHKAGIKTLGFWASALAAVGAVAAQVGGLIPPPYGAIVLAAAPLLYGISRGLKKRDDDLGGVKPALATSDAWANILAALGQVALASQGAVAPETATVLMSVNAAAIAAADSLAKSGAQPPKE